MCFSTKPKGKSLVTKPKKSRLKHRIARAYNHTNFLYFVPVRLIHHDISVDLRLLFDTGATHTGISLETFKFLGVTELKGTVPTITATGPTLLSYGVVENFVLDGQVTAENVLVTMLPSNFFTGVFKNVGGILGGSFLSRWGFFMGGGAIDVFYAPKSVHT